MANRFVTQGAAFSTCLLCACGVASGASADTVVPGGPLATTTWTRAGSPYHVTGWITVPEGSTLTIEAGVVVRFAPYERLSVVGTLLAAGTASEPIVFEGDDSSAVARWEGIRFDASAIGSVLDHAVVREARVGLFYSSVAQQEIDRVRVERCAVGMRLHTSPASPMDAIVVWDNDAGFFAAGDASVELNNAVVVGQRGAGIVLASTGPMVVAHATVWANAGKGIEASAGQSMVLNSIVAGNAVGLGRTGGTLTVEYSDVVGNAQDYAGVTAGTGCFSSNPRFASAVDLRVQADSPCIDTAHPSVFLASDHDGRVRPLDGDGTSGAGADVGAYEASAAPRCGNAYVDPGEGCDDGNRTDGDGCAADCSTADACGDGTLDPGEGCDDGARLSGDGCSATCANEWVCGNGTVDPGERCDPAALLGQRFCTIRCTFFPDCGNGVLEGTEACDDGNLVDGDDCSSSCTRERRCGNGVLEGTEACDDGNNESMDGCSPTCTDEWVCGDGDLDPGEGCDPGVPLPTTSCTLTCQRIAACGDGFVDAGEACDDANTVAGDGCSSGCQLEPADAGVPAVDASTMPTDGGPGDAGLAADAGDGDVVDASNASDASSASDLGTVDASEAPDAGGPVDAGAPVDAGESSGGCGCVAAGRPTGAPATGVGLFGALAAGLALRGRRRVRPSGGANGRAGDATASSARAGGARRSRIGET